MSPEDLEFVILIVAGFLIIGAVIEIYKLLTHHAEVKRQRFLEETRAHRMLRNGEETGQQ